MTYATDTKTAEPSETCTTGRVIDIEPTDARDHARSNLFLSALLETAKGPLPIRIRNISAGGALIHGHSLPFIGESVILRRASAFLAATVVRSNGSVAGLRFDHAFAVSEWLPSTDQSHQDATDRRLAKARERLGSPPPSPTPFGSASPDLPCEEIARRIGEELALVARTLDSIGDDVSADAVILSRHGISLQRMEEAARVLVQLSAVLAAEDTTAAIGDIQMSALKRRLCRRSIQPAATSSR